jgi:hypothetical protein
MLKNKFACEDTRIHLFIYMFMEEKHATGSALIYIIHRLFLAELFKLTRL